MGGNTEDEEFIAIVLELLGCSTFGKTEEKVLEEAKIAVHLWMEAAKETGREIPIPLKSSIVTGIA